MNDATPERTTPRTRDDSTETADERERGSFSVVIPCAIVFILTIFVMIAAAFGQPGSPLARFFDRHGLAIIAVEAVLLVGTALVAMSVDRYLALRAAERAGDNESDTPGSD